MILWPHIPVWPFLLVACLVTSRWNSRIAFWFAAQIVLIRVITELTGENPYVYYFAAYSVTAAIMLLVVDKAAGFVFALISAINAIHLIGFIGLLPKAIINEVLFVLGLAYGAFNQPDRGLLAGLSFAGFAGDIGWLAVDQKSNTENHREN